MGAAVGERAVAGANRVDALELRVPVLRSPFASRLNPHTERAEARALSWVRRCGLVAAEAVPVLARQRFGLLASRSHPDLDLTGLTDICRWYLWFAVLDDQYCDRPPAGSDLGWLGQRLAGIVRSLESPRAADRDPAAWAAADLARRAARRATGEQFRRLIAAFHATFFGLLWEMSGRLPTSAVTVTDYVRMRRYSGALPAFLTLAEIYADGPPSPDEIARPEVIALMHHIGNLIMWQNDIRSYPVEVASGRPVLSLPTVLEQERGLAGQAAVDVAAKMWRAEVQLYRRAREQVLSGASPALHRYADRLHLLLAGFLTWPYETIRYA